jgi:hypothetical protein
VCYNNPQPGIIMKNLFLLAVSLMFVSCASRPTLYPNNKLKSVGKEIAKKDTEQCLSDAEKYLDSSEGKKIAKGAGAGAIIGGAIGAVGGLFTGNIAGGMARGGAMGAGGGAAAGAISPDELKHRYVNQCLADKGYQVIGWD